MQEMITTDRLSKLGFTAVAEKVKEVEIRKRKMAIAYEHYKFVRPENVREFNYKLKAKTIVRHNGEYHRLDFCDIQHWDKVPPADVLGKLEAAQERKCFDSYEVAYIRKVADPLLFGRISGCDDRFFIAQWDNDVKISDLLKDNEG